MLILGSALAPNKDLDILQPIMIMTRIQIRILRHPHYLPTPMDNPLIRPRIQNGRLHAILLPLPIAKKKLSLRNRVLVARNLLPKFKKKTLKRRERAERRVRKLKKLTQK
jgi:hypothetical protein